MSVIRSRTRAGAAVEPNSDDPCAPLITTAGWAPVESWYCTTDWPDRNTALPAAEMAVNSVFWPFMPATTSAKRPPQPVRAPSVDSACHVDCWSLCENRLDGNETERAWYCAFVVG